MKQGLKVALMTVAGALLGLPAMAMAPTILDVPSVVVGSTGNGTDATPYVFGDAFDLNDSTIVADDQTPVKDLIWSYEIVDAKKLYAINGKDSINSATENPNAPGAKQINNSVDARETVNLDGKANTITVRNINLKPFTGTPGTPSGNGIIDAQLVTLYASDGQAYDNKGKQVWFYTDQGGDDRLSMETPNPTTTWTSIANHAFNGNLDGWTWTSGEAYGAVTSSNKGNTALCIASAQTDMGMGNWRSPYGELPLVKNNVYHFRLTMNFTQGSAAAPNTPFWDFSIMNADASNYPNMYSGEFMYLDNEGGTGQGVTAIPNGAASTDFDIYWAPAPVKSANWNSSAVFDSGNATKVNAQLMFRVMDLQASVPNTNPPQGNSGITGWMDSGTICLDNLLVERTDIGNLQNVGAAAYDSQSLNATNSNLKSAYGTLDIGSSCTWNSGVMAVKANGTTAENGGARYREAAQVSPGPENVDASQPAKLPSNFPAVWEADSLYMITFNLSAPDTTSAANPYDNIVVGADVPTNELFSLNTVATSADQFMFVADPKTGAAQPYVAFLQTPAQLTKSTIQNAARIRPRLDLLNHDSFRKGDKSGTVNVHGITVQKVAFQ